MYNLLDEEWIPVLYVDGSWTRRGVNTVLRDAHRIRNIAASNPMDRFAVLRFLLAVLYWCKGNPTEADCRVTQFPAEWFAKLDEHRECFNLLGEGRRFYQTKDSRRPRPTTDLLQEIPTGNNFWHFRHSTDGIEGLCPACCALGLLRLPLFCVSGLPDLKSGINGVPPVYVVAVGQCLLDTLLSVWCRHESLGEPSWSRANDAADQNDEPSLLYGMTVPARLVWLHDPEPAQSACHSCGEIANVIRTCEYQSAGRIEDKRWNDPNAIYRGEEHRRAERAADLTTAKRFRMDRPWHQLVQDMVGKERRVSMIGFATDNAKNVDVWEREVEIQAIADSHIARAILDNWNDAGNRLSDRLRVPERRKKKETPIELKSLVTTLRPHVEHIVSRRVGELLEGSEESWKRAANEYADPLRIVARSLAPDYTAEALQRRREIERALPRWSDPRSITEKPKKARGKRA